MKSPATWLDRAIGFLAPQYGLKRIRSRTAADMLIRHYEAAGNSRRTQGWHKSSGDANAAIGASLQSLRDRARDLVRNNPHAESALSTIADHTVGWGIVPKPIKANRGAVQVWEEWAGTPACDSDGRNDFYGLQKLVMRTVVSDGECLIRRRQRFPDDGLPIPMQLQVLEADYIDTAKTGLKLPNGGRIVNGIEYDVLGRRAAYWMFAEHPGAELSMFSTGSLGGSSVRIRAENILHVFRHTRPGQVRGPSWFAPVLLRFKDFDEYEDAQLIKQKIAACLSVLVSDASGATQSLGDVDTTTTPQIDRLEPGMIENIAPGSSITVVDPPRVGEYGDYCEISLRAIATGLGVAYEDLTGDYTNLPFSAARMSRLRHWSRVEDWRWNTLIPQMCIPVWNWAMQQAMVLSKVQEIPTANWTAPPPPMIDPGKEGLAYQRNIRTGIMSLSEAIRERGYDPDEMLKELAEDNAKLDKLKLVLDSDPRRTTQAGNPTVTTGVNNQDNPGMQPGEDEPPKKPANGEARA